MALPALMWIIRVLSSVVFLTSIITSVRKTYPTNLSILLLIWLIDPFSIRRWRKRLLPGIFSRLSLLLFLLFSPTTSHTRQVSIPMGIITVRSVDTMGCRALASPLGSGSLHGGACR